MRGSIIYAFRDFELNTMKIAVKSRIIYKLQHLSKSILGRNITYIECQWTILLSRNISNMAKLTNSFLLNMSFRI